jgi:AmmeMemoRadiSam system protein B
MNNNQLFNSKTDPIPEIRRDLQIIPIEENGSSYLYFHDEQGYATSDLALQQEVRPLLSLLNGQRSIEDLEPHLGKGVSKNQVLEFVQFLDKHRLLASNYFQQHAEEIESNYEQLSVHSSVTAGHSYPADPDELQQYLDEAFAKHNGNKITSDFIKALYAPHIDPRVALDSYINAFAPIKDLQPKRVVIIATSHYAGLYPEIYKEEPFILVNKDFELPLGTVQRDQQTIEELLQTDDEIGITTQDRAHRMEHSIELHLLFLSYLWDHNFKVVPFLTRDLDDLHYMEDGHLGKQLGNFSALLENRFADDDDTFFLISGDLAHFGNKFGDQTAASIMFDQVEDFDRKFLDHASANRRSELLELMKEDMDPYRICGFPPLYTFLNSMPDLKGEILSYDLWDEREKESAVTFGSILYSVQ